ncbi:MAG: HEAT repeat domain-containing protein [Persicimonas sp.]
MGEYFVGLFEVLWETTIYRALLIVIGVEMVLVIALIIWLWIHAGRQLAREYSHRRFLEALEDDFFAALGDEKALSQWMERAQDYPREFVRDFVADYLLKTRGESHDVLVELYHEFGYAADDHQQARSVSERKRLEAMRRLYVVATEEDREVLLEHANDDYLSRVLAAQTLARVGRPEDIVAALRGLDVKNNMMEVPVHALLEELSREDLRYVFLRWQQFDSPRVRRILLMAGAEANFEEVNQALPVAARSEQMEVRIGACAAAGALADADSLELLIEALDDDKWPVRARAAKALGRRRHPRAIDPLGEALKDRAFWVRQDAAIALRQLGPDGLERLDEVARRSDDRYASESAGQELQRHRLLAHTRGAPA